MVALVRRNLALKVPHVDNRRVCEACAGRWVSALLISAEQNSQLIYYSIHITCVRITVCAVVYLFVEEKTHSFYFREILSKLNISNHIVFFLLYLYGSIA